MCNVGCRRPRRGLLVPAASRLTGNSASSCGDPITCHRQFAGKRPTLLNADCEYKQESTENIRGSNTLPCGALFLPNISRQSLGPTDRADICRQKKKNNNKKKKRRPLMWIYLRLPSRETVCQGSSLSLPFFLMHCRVLFFFFIFWKAPHQICSRCLRTSGVDPDFHTLCPPRINEVIKNYKVVISSFPCRTHAAGSGRICNISLHSNCS